MDLLNESVKIKRIEDVSVNSYIVYYYSSSIRCAPFYLVSDTTANTIINIIDSFVQLYDTKDITKISVKEIINKAGYSRTTFYVHFHDTYDVLHTLEDIILTHTETYSDVFYQMSTLKDNGNALELSIKLMNNYKKYLKVLLKHPDFVARYKTTIKNNLIRKVLDSRIRTFDTGIEDTVTKDYLKEALASVIVDIIIYWLQHEDQTPLVTFLDYSRDIMQIFLGGLTNLDYQF